MVESQEKPKKSCFEFTDSGLISRADMIFERRAHTLTEAKNQNIHSIIYAIDSNLPTESMDKWEYYNVITNTWHNAPSLNTKRNFHSTIAFKQRHIYVMAGFNGGQRTNMIEKLDVLQDKEWVIVNIKMRNHSKKWACLEGYCLFAIDNSQILIL